MLIYPHLAKSGVNYNLHKFKLNKLLYSDETGLGQSLLLCHNDNDSLGQVWVLGFAMMLLMVWNT